MPNTLNHPKCKTCRYFDAEIDAIRAMIERKK